MTSPCNNFLYIFLVLILPSLINNEKILSDKRSKLSLHKPNLTNIIRTNISFELPPSTCETPPSKLDIATGILLIMIISVNIIGNGLVCTAMLTMRSMKRHLSNYPICSLAMSDLLIGILVLPFHIHMSFHNHLFCYLPREACWFFAISDLTFTISAVLNLVGICIDRFIAVVYPHNYRTYITKKCMLSYIALIWLIALIISAGLLNFNWSNPSQPGVKYEQHGDITVCYANNDQLFITLYIAVFLIPFLIMFILYTVIIHKIMHPSRVRESLHMPQHSRICPRLHQREVRATISIIVVFASFICCWAPNISIAISGQLNRSFWEDMYLHNNELMKIISFLCIRFLPPLSTCINPLIYGVLNTNYRDAFRIILSQFFKSSTDVDLTRQRARSDTSFRTVRLQSLLSIRSPMHESRHTMEMQFL